STQRFISRDPIGLEGGPNLYTYAANSPVNFVDPSGLDTGTIIVGGVRVAVGIGITAGEVATGVAGAAAGAIIGLTGTAIADGMRPVPGGNGTPYFPDTMGEDRMGRRQYEARSEQFPDEAPEPRPDKVPPRPEKALPKNDKLLPINPKNLPKPGRDSRTSDNLRHHNRCIMRYKQCVGEAKRLAQTQKTCDKPIVENLGWMYLQLCNQWKRQCLEQRSGPFAT
ncbi:MAG: RHS repeat-associated core domain-containing protein, partial [Candidatus Eremiobacteraeota bacterium]|nr:RHS repeat-associated core domain-containing protein [Candidatus Eremiobacteraeota bacterium]